MQNDDKGVNFGIASTVVRLQFIIYMTGSDIFDGITPITHGKIEQINNQSEFCTDKYLFLHCSAYVYM